MTKSILRYFIVILVVALLSSCVISGTLLSNSILDTTEHDMLYSLKLIDYALDYQQPLDGQIEKLNPLAYSDDTRISVIDLKGNVVADTAKDSISENHLNREEIQEALKFSEGYAQRKSETTGEDTLYVALYNHEDYIIRLAIPYHGITD